MKLAMPVVCSCGYATMDAADAIRHIKTKHPEEWVEDVVFCEAQEVVQPREQKPWTEDDARALAYHGEDD